MTSRQLALD